MRKIKIPLKKYYEKDYTKKNGILTFRAVFSAVFPGNIYQLFFFVRLDIGPLSASFIKFVKVFISSVNLFSNF
ncbi:hypothetical protein BMS3Abin04_00246 [bacterium BMS3Abin04]|nr:hypothetical protein BMS3Abin04_00246 [bacterium BMS3Abin04]